MATPLLKAEDVARRLNVEPRQLEESCEETVLPSLATFVHPWREVFSFLLAPLDIDDINSECLSGQEKRLSSLRKWKQRRGTEATYAELINALLKNGSVDKAETLCLQVQTILKEREMAAAQSVRETSDVATKNQGCPPQNSPVCTVGEPSCGLEVQIEQLDQQYIEMEGLVLKTIKLRRIPLDDVLNWIRFPPTKLRTQFAYILRQQAKDISSTTNVDELFAILSSYWDIFHPALLEHLVNKLGDKNLKTRMDRYMKDLQRFRVTTTLGNFLDKWVGDIPPGYQEFVLELGEQWREKTVEDLEQFRIKMSRMQSLGGGHMSFIKTTKTSSILVIFSLPKQLFPMNFRLITLHEFLRNEQVLKVLVGGECVLDLEKLAEYERRLFEICCESESNDSELVQLLMQPGVDPNFYKDGRTPLWVASYFGKNNIARSLIQHGAKVDLPNNNEFGESPLLAASRNGHTSTCILLLEKGATVDFKNKQGVTSLFFASQEGHTQVAKLLLEHRAQVDLPNDNGSTPLYAASQNGNIAVVTLLLDRGADVDHSNKDGATSLRVASFFGHLDIARALIEKGATIDYEDQDGRTALYIASQEGHTEIVAILLDQGADVSHPDKDGFTALRVASAFGRLDVARLLIEKGAPVNYQDKGGATPLELASQSGHAEVANTLIHHGADVNHQDKKGNTPFMTASESGHVEVARTLIHHGVDVNHQNEKGATALELASQEGHVHIARFLIHHGADINRQVKNGMTALILASIRGHTDVVETLLEAGAKPDIQDKNGFNSLIIATMRGYKDIVATLLNNRANPNLKEKTSSWTPLHFAAKEGLTETVALLLKCGANVELRDKNGLTAFQIAKANGNEAVCNSLENYYNIRDKQLTEDQEKQMKQSYQHLRKIIDALLPSRVQKRKHKQFEAMNNKAVNVEVVP